MAKSILRFLDSVKLAIVVANVASVIGFVAARMSDAQNLPAGGLALMTGGIAFVACLILSARDNTVHKSVMASVRPMLLAQSDMSDQQFCSHFADRHPELLVEIRMAIGNFFEVPRQKIHPLHYWSHYHQNLLEQATHIAIVNRVRERYRLPRPIYTLQKLDVGATVREFVERIADVIECSAD